VDSSERDCGCPCGSSSCNFFGRVGRKPDIHESHPLEWCADASSSCAVPLELSIDPDPTLGDARLDLSKARCGHAQLGVSLNLSVLPISPKAHRWIQEGKKVSRMG